MAGIRVFVLNSWTVVLSREPQADTSAREREIDALVAARQLCGLTENEVKIVEGEKK